MAERTSITQVCQVGVESTPGTGVSADKQLLTVNIMPAVQSDTKYYKPMGGKYPTIQAQGKEWVEAAIEGGAVYTDLVYLLSSAVSYAAPSRLIPSTGLAYQWDFTPAQYTEDTVKTFTVETGSAARAHKFVNGIVTELGVAFSRDEVTINGSMLGKGFSDGITLTATPTAIDQVPILPKQLDVYMDTASGSLGGTKLTRVLDGEFKIANRFGAFWPVNSTLGTGFGGTIETEPEVTLRLKVEADSAGMGPLTALRDGSKRFLRLVGTGANIETGPPSSDYLFRLDLSGTVSEIGEFSDEDGLYAIEYTFKATHDTTWGKPYTIRVINKLAAL